MVICLELGAVLHVAQLMPLPLTVSCFSKIQIGFTLLVPARLGSPGKGLLNGCVCRLCQCGCRNKNCSNFDSLPAATEFSNFRWNMVGNILCGLDSGIGCCFIVLINSSILWLLDLNSSCFVLKCGTHVNLAEDWPSKVQRLTRYKIGLFGNVLPSQSLGSILNKLNQKD